MVADAGGPRSVVVMAKALAAGLGLGLGMLGDVVLEE